MIIQADAKGLETYCVAYLSQDQVLMKELIEGLDVHGSNQEAFGLPSRLIAKVFVFRLIYGGSAYSYAHDPDFMGVTVSLRMTPAQREKLSRLGGAGWVRDRIDRAKEPNILS